MGIDGVYNDVKDTEGFLAECRQGQQWGFDGKTLIHPGQVEGANAAFAPSEEAVDDARGILRAWEDGAGAGVVTYNGRMVENLHVESAQRTLSIHEAIEALEASAPGLSAAVHGVSVPHVPMSVLRRFPMRRTLVVLIAFALADARRTRCSPPPAPTPLTVAGAPAARGGTTIWTPPNFLAGAGTVGASGKAPKKVVKVRRRGKVRKHPVRRAIALEVQTSTGWVTLDKGRTSKKGAYSLSDPLNWYGNHVVRVKAQGRPKFVATQTYSISGGYNPVGTVTDFAFLGGAYESTWRFNPCSTVNYQINAAEVGDAGVQLAQQAMAQISAATGIEVKYVGPSTMIPAATPDAPLPQGVNLVIAWGNNAEVAEFAARSADGLGGPRKGFYVKDAKGRRVTMTTEAGVTLQTEAWNGSYDPALESLTRPTVGPPAPARDRPRVRARPLRRR